MSWSVIVSCVTDGGKMMTYMIAHLTVAGAAVGPESAFIPSRLSNVRLLLREDVSSGFLAFYELTVFV